MGRRGDASGTPGSARGVPGRGVPGRGVPGNSKSVAQYGWPPAAPHYVRGSTDFDDPPLVGGRPVRMQKGCSLCEVASGLVDGGTAAASAAWAEYDLAFLLYTNEAADEAIRAFNASWGVRFGKREYEKHRKEHVPSVVASRLDALSKLDARTFDDSSWREIFDGLHLSVSHMRRAVASGELRPTMNEGLQAAKLLSDLMAVSIADRESQEKSPLSLMFAVIDGIRQIIDREIADPDLRDTVHLAIVAHTTRLIGASPGDDAKPAYPRGREGDEVEGRDGDAESNGSTGEDGDV